MQTHAMIPTPEHVGGSCWKIYFSGRCAWNVSHIGWAILDLDSPMSPVDFSVEPVLSPGELGCFDDNGVTPSCVVNHDGKTYLYYIGWNPGFNVRMHLFGGLAISEDNGETFQRWSRAPIIERSRSNPFLNTAPFAMRDGAIWRMYFVGGVGWRHKDLPRYNIQFAWSDDGKNWMRDGTVCIDFADESENALARPFVVKEEGVYKMWFAHKGNAYRLGYAESENGVDWHRDDSYAGLDVSNDSFDNAMVEYAAIIEHRGQKHMFYNGNNYGQGGIGLASEV